MADGKRAKGAGEKLDQFWSSIDREKLDTLKYVVLHSGINVAALQNDDGLTAIQVAASNDKHKALLLMLDLMRQQRCLRDCIDVPEEETGRTALMMAAGKGHVKCVDHLCVVRARRAVHRLPLPLHPFPAPRAQALLWRVKGAQGRGGQGCARLCRVAQEQRGAAGAV